MEQTWGPPGSYRPRLAQYWAHEPCYQGNHRWPFQITILCLLWDIFLWIYLSYSVEDNQIKFFPCNSYFFVIKWFFCTQLVNCYIKFDVTGTVGHWGIWWHYGGLAWVLYLNMRLTFEMRQWMPKIINVHMANYVEIADLVTFISFLCPSHITLRGPVRAAQGLFWTRIVRPLMGPAGAQCGAVWILLPH